MKIKCKKSIKIASYIINFQHMRKKFLKDMPFIMNMTNLKIGQKDIMKITLKEKFLII